MKIRSGFVSNSSSSSFVCIAKPGVIQKALKDEDKLTQKVVKGYLNPNNASEIVLDGNKYELYQTTISTDDFACDCDLDSEEDYEKAYDAWSDFTAKLAQIPNVVVRDEYC